MRDAWTDRGTDVREAEMGGRTEAKTLRRVHGARCQGDEEAIGTGRGVQNLCLRIKINDLARLRGKDLKEQSKEAEPGRRPRKRACPTIVTRAVL